MEYRIISWRLPELRKLVDKMQKRAFKLKVEVPQLTVLGTEEQILKNGKVLNWTTVELTGVSPKLEGWSLVARIIHEDAGNVFMTVPGESVPEVYRYVPPMCEHCQTTRYRKDTFIVRRDDVHKQVGSNCIADFLGHPSLQGMAEYLEWLGSIDNILRGMAEDEDGEDRGRRKHVEEKVETLTVLAYSAAAVEQFGWTSRSTAKEFGKYATADRVSHDILVDWGWLPVPYDRQGIPLPRIKVEQQHKELAGRVLTWVREGMKRDNDYTMNLFVACSNTVIPFRLIGIVASAVSAFTKAQERQAEREARAKEFAASEHIGTVGKREIFHVKVLSVRTLESNFGITYMHKMIDPQGNVMIWYSSGEELTEGAEYEVKATVKEHSLYAGTKQTKVSRVSVVNDLTPVAA